MIENEGYDACLQKAIPNLRIKGDKTTNPEVLDTYELIHAVPVEEGKPEPDVIIDFGKVAKACGLGEMGLNGKIINKEHGPFMRYCFIITDAPIECDDVEDVQICDKCGAQLKQRKDDSDPEAIRKRLEIYEEKTSPLVNYYENKGVLRTETVSLSINRMGKDVAEDIVKDIKGM